MYQLKSLYKIVLNSAAATPQRLLIRGLREAEWLNEGRNLDMNPKQATDVASKRLREKRAEAREGANGSTISGPRFHN